MHREKIDLPSVSRHFNFINPLELQEMWESIGAVDGIVICRECTFQSGEAWKLCVSCIERGS